MDPSSVDNIIHIISVALTPIFLLAGVSNLLGVFSTRLGRVADRVDLMSARLETAQGDDAVRVARQLRYLGARSLVLDGAVVLGTIGGAATCGAALALFIGTLGNLSAASLLFFLFGLALASTIAALGVFLIEMLMAGRSLRAEASRTAKTTKTS